MAREIPEFIRAAVGLAATVLDEARKLPETLPGLPIRLIGLAMQQAMKVQQQYAGFVARGDELFTGLRGADEPGLATFDDDEEPVPATAPGFRDSAFDRAPETDEPSAGAAAEKVGDPLGAAHAALDELAIDELVDQAPMADATAPSAADTLDAEPTADVATSVDVLTPEGGIATVDATVTDEGIAATEGADASRGPAAPAGVNAPGGDSAQAATAIDESGTPVAAATGVRTDVGGPDTSADDAEGAAVDAVGETSTAPSDDAGSGSQLSGSQAAGTAPVDGYDAFSIAQLRGRLRGYALSTVQDLVAYEEATRAREPYLKMLRNRLEKLEEQAVEASPLAPRGA